MTHEHSLVAPNEAFALLRIEHYFLEMRVRNGIRKWRWRVKPTVEPYAGTMPGQPPKYGKGWRAYGRISYSK